MMCHVVTWSNGTKYTYGNLPPPRLTPVYFGLQTHMVFRLVLIFMPYVCFHFTHTHTHAGDCCGRDGCTAVQGRPDQCYETARLNSNGIRIISHHQGAMEDRVGERGAGEIHITAAVML